MAIDSGEQVMRRCTHLLIVALIVGAVAPAAADVAADQRVYAAKCKAESFAHRGPGTLSSVMRNAEIQRCIKNKGLLIP
jgi:hypothetical protein